MLDLKNISFWYRRNALPVVHKCNFSVGDEEFVVLTGPSGCGKSTLLRIAAGLLIHDFDAFPERGHVLEGHCLWNHVEFRAPLMDFAYVPQMFQQTLLRGRTVKANVLMGVPKKSVTAALKHSELLLSKTGISDLENVPVCELSGGQQQRVAICRALVNRPRIVFMDEPFANLDPLLKPEITSLLKDLRTEFKLSTCIVTHDLLHARELADTIVKIENRSGRPMYSCEKVSVHSMSQP